jgi:hypothetical protein
VMPILVNPLAVNAPPSNYDASIPNMTNSLQQTTAVSLLAILMSNSKSTSSALLLHTPLTSKTG